jgi:S-adenosylmethionine/arginine decarboxylase-like enzyme
MNTHKHLIVTGFSRNPPKQPEYIIDYLYDLVEIADMEVFMPPQARYCEDPNNAGVTGTIVITTSHASVHVWDKNGLVQADLYSCKDFNEKKVVEFIKNVFNLASVEYKVIDRKPKVSWLKKIFKGKP